MGKTLFSPSFIYRVQTARPERRYHFYGRLRRCSNFATGQPRLNVIPRDQHCISRKNISDSALKVMSRLRSQGHQAYLVGGAVRDLLLGGHPKDFDIATDATPEQVNALFRNSRIIGRRFRIVHVRFGREIIEVTTFRGHHDNGDDSHARDSGQGRSMGPSRAPFARPLGAKSDDGCGGRADSAGPRDLRTGSETIHITAFPCLPR